MRPKTSGQSELCSSGLGTRLSISELASWDDPKGYGVKLVVVPRLKPKSVLLIKLLESMSSDCALRTALRHRW
jgi:hypothetical protein